ncbi:hypothetical protein U9M48_001554 [Paspalum notatum var. saurae]|uniref:AAA+ ATPase domain-containing protein n=1 Tax=Paspalum notatum var. saurae TaxID=547442 RepID=A0AAQ3PIC1_PASNO
MEVVTGALPSLLRKLGDLLVGEYRLHKGVKGEILFLQAELQSMHGALEKISGTPADRLDVQDRIWARDVRELSYDVDDTIDAFLVHGIAVAQARGGGFKKHIDRSLHLLTRLGLRRKVAAEIRGIKSRVVEVSSRHERYRITAGGAAAPRVDPRLWAQRTAAAELVGIDEARDEMIGALVEVQGDGGRIVSVVGFGGLGKTTLARVVYQRLRARFDCSAFVTVSRDPDMQRLFQDMFYQLAQKNSARTNVVDEIGEFLQRKRYFIVLDDIWDISVWRMIRCALPDDNGGYRIITTTRNFNVAEQIGGAYKLKPLSFHNSKILLYRRIFGNEDKGKCPNQQLADVSDRILKKCAGVPLAIITIASLLASKGENKLEWYKVYNSVGTGLENNLDVSNMRMILSLSYYDMPSYLRTCLLYLSVFPEDYKIDKVRLIEMWMAEGFVQCGKQGQSLFDAGEIYFNDLINRSIIQPIYDSYSGLIEGCRVHDMVLDLIRSLSSEENFATVLNGMDCISPSTTIRRLSLQNGNEDNSVTRSLQQVRSVFVFPSSIGKIPGLESFRVLRVLSLQGCELRPQGYSLKHLGNLFHLRYLGLRSTHIAQLPEEIGNMRFLQTLDVRHNNIPSLPSNVVQLKKLMFLHTDWSTRVPNGIGNLTCLERLLLRIDSSSSMDIIDELGQLTEMRVLRIVFDEWDDNDKVSECLCKLQKLTSLYIEVIHGQRSIGGLDAWVAPPHHLCRLDTRRSCWFSALPAWMNPSLVPNLSFLWIAVRELQQEGLDILGRLPALRSLDLEVDHESLEIHGRFSVGAGSFPSLVHCKLWGFVRPLVFQQGAMPKLRELYLDLFLSTAVCEARETDSSDGGGLDLMGLGSLPLLQDVVVEFRSSQGASMEDVEQAKSAMGRATETHPNHPRLCILL